MTLLGSYFFGNFAVLNPFVFGGFHRVFSLCPTPLTLLVIATRCFLRGGTRATTVPPHRETERERALGNKFGRRRDIGGSVSLHGALTPVTNGGREGGREFVTDYAVLTLRGEFDTVGHLRAILIIYNVKMTSQCTGGAKDFPMELGCKVN